MKNLFTTLFFAFALIFVSNVSFANGPTPSCEEINNQLDLLFSGYLNHPTTRQHMKNMSKTEAHEYRKAMRNKLNARFGGDCFNGEIREVGRPVCDEIKADVKRLYSGYVNHPTNRTRQKQMTKQEKRAWKQAVFVNLKARYGAGCY